MQAIVNGLLTSYERTGSRGKTILLLHGWADSKETFEQLPNKLTNSYDLISLDLPGFGGSETPKTPWALDDFANFIAGFIKKLNLEVDCIIGHSNGGAIAIHGLSNNTFQADKLVLIASSGVRNPGSIRNKALKLASKPAKLAVSLAPRKSQQKIKKKLYKSIGSDYMVSENMKETFKNIVSADVLDDASKVIQPTILIYGDKDESTPVSLGRKLEALIKGSRLYVIDNAGHFVHQEKTDKVASIIEDFIG